MHSFLLSIACFLTLVYVTYCNPRLPENVHKPEANSPVGELEPLSEQMEPLLQLQVAEEDPDKRGDWNKLSGVWGKRGDWNKLSGVWGKRGDWNKLSGVWGKRGDWNKLSGVWGKRGTNWNNLSNMWGKRETSDLPPYWGKRGWNNLSGVWGKRGWNNLSNVWGKRSSSRDDGSKRTTSWNNLKSVWGKRDADWDVPAVWDRIPSDEDTFPGLYIPDQM